MDFMLWAALSLHIFSVIIWLGSLCFLSAILYPVFDVEKQSGSNLTIHLHRRLMPFLWLSLWSIGITGIALYIFSPEFLYGQEGRALADPVHIKIVFFVIIVIFSVQLKSRYTLYQHSDDGTQRTAHLRIMARTSRITILFGILSLLLAAWKAVSKTILY